MMNLLMLMVFWDCTQGLLIPTLLLFATVIPFLFAGLHILLSSHFFILLSPGAVTSTIQMIFVFLMDKC